MSERRLGTAEKRVLKVRLLKAFLLRCEALGWVNRFGRLGLGKGARARDWWRGAFDGQFAANVTLFDEAEIASLQRGDAFVVAGQMHRELCAQMRSGVQA